MSEIPTNNEIAILMSRLLTDYTELMNNFYDIFFNPEPQEITLSLCDDQGNIQTVTIPNRAMDREYILNGSGNPEGVITANIGSLYQDIANGEVYIKQSATTNIGWSKIVTLSILSNYIKQGTGNPEGVISAPKGTIYSDISTGIPYIKQTSSGNSGWVLIGNNKLIVQNPLLIPDDGKITWEVTNSLGTENIIVQVKRVDTNAVVNADIISTSTTITVIINSTENILANTYKIIAM